MKETCPHTQQNIAEQDQAWKDYQEYISGFGLQAPEPDFAFSRGSKKKIKQEADNSPYPGYDFGSNECSHYDHDRGQSHYNDPSNGHLVNRPEHWIEHNAAANGEVDNGCTKAGNSWAAKKIWNRMSDDEKDYARRR